MKIILNRILAFFVLLFCAFTSVSCDSAVSEGGEALVRFGEADGSSRGISADDLEGYTVDSLYWAYVAVKKDGLHTIGESEVTTAAASADYSKIVTVDGKNYILRPVRPDYEPGLNVEVGPFSYGDWLFKLYGFKGCDGTKFTNLVYTGDTVGYSKTPKVYERITKSSTAISVGFELSPATGSGTAFPTTGTLVFGSLYYTVPANMKFYAGTTFTVTFKDATNGDKVVATATGTITTDCETGTKIPLSITYGAATAFDSGIQGQFSTPSPSYQAEHKFKVEIVYQKGVTSGDNKEEAVTVSTPRQFPVLFTAGNLTVLYGDIDDVDVNSGTTEVDDMGAVCRIGTKYYTNLADAVNDYVAGGSPIVVLRNIDYGGVFSKDFKICPSGKVVVSGSELTTQTYVRNIKMNGSKKIEFVSSDSSTATPAITYTGNENTLDYCGWTNSDGFIHTNGGSVTFNSTGNFYHTGTSAAVTVTSAANDKTNGKGYHCWGKVTGTLTVTKGYVDFGAAASVGTLTTNPTASGDVVLTGKPTTSIGNMSTIYAGTSLTDTKLQSPYKKVVFNGNGGKSGTATSLTKYGIEGMYLYDVVKMGTFVYSPYAHVCWASDSKGASPLFCCDTVGSKIGNTNYLVGSAATQNLYAFWEKGLPVGGYIFAICSSAGTPCTSEIKGLDNGVLEIESGGAKFQFLKADGSPVNIKDKKYKTVYTAGSNAKTVNNGVSSYSAKAGAYDLLTALKDATYYKVLNKPATYKDRIYVCPKDGFGPKGYTFTGTDGKGPAYVAWGGTGDNYYGVQITTGSSAEPTFGSGRTNSAAVLASSTDIYTWGADSNKNSTIWSYIDWLNHGGKSVTTGTPWVSYTSAARDSQCNDWFVPVRTEIEVMDKSGIFDTLGWFTKPSDANYRCIFASNIWCYSTTDSTNNYRCDVWVKQGGTPSVRSGLIQCGFTNYTTNCPGTIPCRSF